mmetsp:Transcript_4950/g.5085  ORF Transcript_4950/g.5085 Transcript_4950/m.5085 type:complete len:1012 (-) Transcript_4950:261-3296(-)|eukprot:CAMPEP_0182428006 /NCGR_PEP_ID=MMETSP1167-20130531/20947_1 /TAXON_ID=2988 /ORGANISM="Mallomonas Sp, Strain CCMP3275" /LENGTH=1011 /DNA_ID=CAMNT_0024610625 /DNA_START=206 /DNA_END=3241 /DNA_ORIENTATION=+
MSQQRQPLKQQNSIVSRMLGSGGGSSGSTSATTSSSANLNKEPADDIGGIVRSGYLVKLATKSKLNWKKRFFVLHENNLKYFTDHISTTGACKGEFLICASTIVTDVDRSVGKDHCLLLKNRDEDELVVSARDMNDKRAWKEAIETAIHRTKNSTRGYAMKLDQFDDKPVRKFFILHDKMLTYHQDEDHTGAIQGMIELSSGTKVQVSEEMYALSLTDAEKNRIILQFDTASGDFNKWKTSILTVTGRVQQQSTQSDDTRIQKALAAAVKKGALKVRPPTRSGDVWEERQFILTSSELIQFLKLPENGVGGRIVESFRIHPSCSVFETNLGPFAFELVTSEKVLHVMGDSKETTNSWMIALRDTIFHSQPEPDDPLLQAALKKIETDVFYTVTFREDKPLGVVLERTGEWAVVKLSNFKDTGVYIGSALVSVNDVDVTLLTYAATIEKLKNWKPPLKLGFRKAPSRQGYLIKQARSNNRSGMKKSWTQRYFTLDEGRLMYKENDATDVTLKGDFPLMGSAVSLVSEEETGRPYCFRLVSGVTCLIMNATSEEDMMDWAATLYHAIAIANGGAHLIAIERDRVQKEAAKEALRLKAEEDAKEAARLAELAVKEEEERIAAEAAKAEEEKKRLEEASTELAAAMEEKEIIRLTKAIEEMDALDLPDAPLLSEARDLLQTLVDQRNAEVLSKELATKQLETELESAQAQQDISNEQLEALHHAIENAKRAGVEVERVAEASTVLVTLRHRKQRKEELTRMLKFALQYKSTAGLREAIKAADDEIFTDISILEDARAMLKDLEEEQAAAKAAEDERLAKEAEELDREMASLDTGDEEGEEEEEESKDKVEAPPNVFRRLSDATKTASGTEKSTPSVVKIVRQPDNKYTRQAMLDRKSSSFGFGQDDEEDVSEGDLPSIDSIRDEDIGRVFDAYARRSGSGTINPMQFSTIWRMLTGDKGNLYQQMQIFHKFDANNNGALSSEDFIAGWRKIASEPGGERLLRKIKTLTSEDNVIL